MNGFRWLVAISLLWVLAGCAGSPPLNVGNGAIDARRQQVIKTAQRHIGTPYRLGGTSPAEGLDCSGLTLLSYQQVGIQLPRSSDQQYHFLPKVDVAQPGDLLFFGSRDRAWHVGLYVGNNTMIHAPGKGRRVQRTALSIPYWRKHYLGAGRLMP